MNKWLWLDMDGTIANLYGVENWLNDLINERTRPYDIAKPLYNNNELASALAQVKEKGYNVGVVSWLSKKGTKAYNRQVVYSKKVWLEKNGLSKIIDKTLIVEYGVNKSRICKKYGYGILVDDESQNLESWENGKTINANNNIIKELAKLN